MIDLYDHVLVFNGIRCAFVNRNFRQNSGECIARSDYAYVQVDLAPHSVQIKSKVANGRTMVKLNQIT